MTVCEAVMPDVDSSAILRIYYSANRRELFVTFVSGRTYVYFDVSPQQYRGFLDAPSQGRYFNANIRDLYRVRELTPSH